MKPYHIKKKPIPLILGVEDGTQAARFVRSELRRSGVDRIRFGDCGAHEPQGWILAMGKTAWKVVPGIEGRGRLYGTDQVFVYPTFHPGYVRRRKSLLPLFRQDLRTFTTFAMLDLYGKVL